MHLATALFVLTTVFDVVANARPVPRAPTAFPSVAVSGTGKVMLGKGDMDEMARLAKVANAAYCPSARGRHVEPTSQAAFGAPDRQVHGTVLVTSEDDSMADLDNAPDMTWFISHSPETATLTLSISSLPTVDEFVETLTDSRLVPLPANHFGDSGLNKRNTATPRIYAPFVPALESHGAAALTALLDILHTPPALLPRHGCQQHTGGSLWDRLVRTISGTDSVSPASLPRAHITHVQITGHGAGAAVGLLTAAALKLELAHAPLTPSISATLFSLPRVGDAAFAAYIDTLASDDLRLTRVASYADAVPHLPGKHLGLAHPTSVKEVWVGEDKHVYACGELGACAESVKVGHTRLADHAGPFGGVWIGTQSCVY